MEDEEVRKEMEEDEDRGVEGDHSFEEHKEKGGLKPVRTIVYPACKDKEEENYYEDSSSSSREHEAAMHQHHHKSSVDKKKRKQARRSTRKYTEEFTEANTSPRLSKEEQDEIKKFKRDIEKASRGRLQSKYDEDGNHLQETRIKAVEYNPEDRSVATVEKKIHKTRSFFPPQLSQKMRSSTGDENSGRATLADSSDRLENEFEEENGNTLQHLQEDEDHDDRYRSEETGGRALLKKILHPFSSFKGHPHAGADQCANRGVQRCLHTDEYRHLPLDPLPTKTLDSDHHERPFCGVHKRSTSKGSQGSKLKPKGQEITEPIERIPRTFKLHLTPEEIDRIGMGAEDEEE